MCVSSSAENELSLLTHSLLPALAEFSNRLKSGLSTALALENPQWQAEARAAIPVAKVRTGVVALTLPGRTGGMRCIPASERLGTFTQSPRDSSCVWRA